MAIVTSSKFQGFKDFLRKHAATLINGLAFLTTILAVIIAIVVVAFVSVHLNLTAGESAPPIWRWVADRSFALLGFDPATPAQYASGVGVALNGLLVIITVFFAVQPFYASFVQRQRAREQQTIQTHSVHVDGVDDIAVMKSLYADAERVIIFSGDFSWLKDNPDFADMLHKKVNRIRCVSYSSRAEVEKALGEEVFQRFVGSFVFDSPMRIKASLAVYSGHKVFLYKTHTSNGRDISKMVCVVTPQGDSRYLLDALSTFAEYFASDNEQLGGAAPTTPTHG